MTGRLRLSQHALRYAIIDVIGVKVAAGFLHSDNIIDEFFSHRPHLWTVARLQREPHRLGPFINVGVRKNGPSLIALALIGQSAEINQAAISLEQVVSTEHAFANIS